MNNKFVFYDEYPGVLDIHLPYKWTIKGRKAIDNGVRIFKELFEVRPDVQVIKGMLPTTKETKPLRWLSTAYWGFKSYGVFDHPKHGPHELLILTRDDFKRI